MQEEFGESKIVEEKPMGVSHHLRISRKDSLVNDLKNSTTSGILSFVIAIGAWATFITAIIRSYKLSGAGGRSIGVLASLSFLASIVSICFGIAGFRNHNKVRHYMERRGILLSALLWVLLLVIFFWGLFGLE